MKIIELQKLWETEKEFYQGKEIGSGVQFFVKKVLQNENLFNLKAGKLSTSDIDRKFEYLEEHSKKNRRADIVIYVNSEIIIPLEVERKDNIDKGVVQIFQYQKDWQKKLGILTDGNEWRFYKSSQYKTFYIADILNNAKDFVTYWNYYIKPQNYYLELFDSNNQLLNNQLNLNFSKNRLIFFDEVTQLISNFKIKLKLIGVFDQNENEKTAIETCYSYLIQFILYKVLIDNDYSNFKKDYDHTVSKIKKAIKDADFYSIIINEIKNISEFITENVYQPFKNEQKIINQKLAEKIRKDLNIEDIAPWLDIILFINRYNFADLKNEIFGFIYENFLKDLYNKNSKGQFFTDPDVVNFMLDKIGFTPKELKQKAIKNEISIIDPSCGAGTFLYSSVDRIIETFDDGTKRQGNYIKSLVLKNILGIDIEEFSLYLAEMNIIMRLLPLIINDKYQNSISEKLKIFKTKDSISEFLDTYITAEEEEINLFSCLKKTALDYPSFMRDQDGLIEMFSSLQQKAGFRERFDYVIGNPPYISYNQCSKQKIEFVKNTSMSNVYGINLNTAPGRIKAYSPKPNLYSYFIALGLALLKPKGKICYIIPQTVLINADQDVIRYHLSQNTTIEKIITFEGKMFIGRGLKQKKPVATSSLIFVARKEKPAKNHKIIVENYKPYIQSKNIDIKEYLNPKNKTSKSVEQDDLKNNIFNWSFLKYNETFAQIIKTYNKHLTINEYRNSLSNYDHIVIDGSVNLLKKDIIKEDIENVTDYYIIPKMIFGKNKAEIFGYYKKDDKIKKAQGSRNHNILLQRPYKILWKYINFDGFYYTDTTNLIPMYQQYCFASTDKSEILFLFAILNSNFTKFLLKKTFKIGNEDKLTFILGLTFVKEFIHIPKITDKNKFIKKEIIRQTEKLIHLESLQLRNFVDFTTSKQKFEKVIVEKNNLVLIDKKGNTTVQNITNKINLVQNIVLQFEKSTNINLSDLKYAQVIDLEQQNKIKQNIEYLIFALYFEPQLQTIEYLKELCEKNSYYQYIK